MTEFSIGHNLIWAVRFKVIIFVIDLMHGHAKLSKYIQNQEDKKSNFYGKTSTFDKRISSLMIESFL